VLQKFYAIQNISKKHLCFLNGRLFYTFVLLVLQGLTLYALIYWASLYVPFNLLFSITSVIMVFWLINRQENTAYKIMWLLIILTLPLFGILLYWCFGKRDPGRPIYKRVRRSTYRGYFKRVEQNKEVMDELRGRDISIARQAEFIVNSTGLTVCEGTQTEFFCPCERLFNRMLEELRQAKKFIFLEFFTIREGQLWNTILEILRQKVKEGVDVRVIYDDMGTIKTLPAGYNKKLEAIGIKCEVFNPMIPLLTIRHNNRNHKKVCIIDGDTAFTGGFNLSDEYINAVEIYGHWVDSGILIRGKAVKNLLVPYLAIWNFLRKTKDDPDDFLKGVKEFENDGFVLPYAVDPFTEEDPAASIYINMISRAKSYVFINTPYFIIDYSMEHALMTAALSGVDIRICFPGVYDKFFVYILSQSYFKTLIKAGVKFYVYLPGFIHSKTFVSDDETAIIGTINLDYRSLFLHFENAVWLYGSRAVLQMKEDFLNRLELCHKVTLEELQNIHWLKKAACYIMKPFAPFY
jgi:cardiolipin synthase